MNLGSTISDLRKLKGLTQKGLAKKCKLKQAYISQIEGNKKEPNLSTLNDISSALETPLPLIFLMSLEERDIPKHKREIFEAMRPTISGVFKSIYDDGPASDNK